MCRANTLPPAIKSRSECGLSRKRSADWSALKYLAGCADAKYSPRRRFALRGNNTTQYSYLPPIISCRMHAAEHSEPNQASFDFAPPGGVQRAGGCGDPVRSHQLPNFALSVFTVRLIKPTRPSDGGLLLLGKFVFGQLPIRPIRHLANRLHCSDHLSLIHVEVFLSCSNR